VARGVGLVLDDSDLREALAVLKGWAERAAELPRYLRHETEWLMEPGTDRLAQAERQGEHILIGPSPRLLALVGNLRAQERKRP
jgi:hypothetical protein